MGKCPKCPKCPKPICPKRRKRLPSINPFFHYLKCVWRKFRGCKRSVVVRYAVKKWRRMSKTEKQPFYDAACRAQYIHRRGKDFTPPGPMRKQSKFQARCSSKPKCLKKKKKKKSCRKC